MSMIIRNSVVWLLVLAVVLCCGAARGNVNLEWRPAAQMVRLGATIQLAVYAVSDDPETSQPISAMDVLLQWDAATMELIGVDNNGPYPWFQSGFPDDSALDGLNNTWADGDAKYTALANFLSPALATPDGLLVTTFEFHAAAPTPANTLTIPPALGQYSETAVFGIAFPGQNVTGALGSATVTICDGPADGDMNGDGVTNGLDLQAFADGLLNGSTTPIMLCHGDFDESGVIDMGDVAEMVSLLLN